MLWPSFFEQSQSILKQIGESLFVFVSLYFQRLFFKGLVGQTRLKYKNNKNETKGKNPAHLDARAESALPVNVYTTSLATIRQKRANWQLVITSVVCWSQYTLFQNGRHHSVLLFTFKLPLVASLWNLKFKRIFPLTEATRANFQSNKSTLKWRPFWNNVWTFFILIERRMY